MRSQSKKIKILFCYTEIAWIDLLRQLGNFNWGPGWCNNIVTTRSTADRIIENDAKFSHLDKGCTKQ